MDIHSGGKYPSNKLSNFAPNSFVLDKIHCASMEGFLQGLKYKNPDMQQHVCTLVGMKAKRTGAQKNWQSNQTLYWKGKSIKRSSDAYQSLLDRAFRAMFDQNMGARKALLATGNAVLKHSIGRSKMNETVLTKREFVNRLMDIRKEYQISDMVEL